MSVIVDSSGNPILSSGGAANIPAAGSSILTPEDLTYIGYLRLPLNYNVDDTEGGIRLPFSQGAMTGRYVGGVPHLFITQSDSGTWHSPVIELLIDGTPNLTLSSAPRLGVYNIWGNIYGSGLDQPINSGTQPVHKGLHWDGEKLLWAWGPMYDGSKDRTIGATTFSGTTSKTPYGTWRTQEHPKRCNGYMTEIPASFASAYLGGKNVAVGGPISSINETCAWGPNLVAFDAANLLATSPSSFSDQNDVAIPTKTLILWTNATRMPRNFNWIFCGWNHPETYACADGFFQLAPTGIVSDIDCFSACSWIETSTKRGIVYFGCMADVPDGGFSYPSDGVPHVWYAPGTKGVCCHGHGNGSGGAVDSPGLSGNSPGPNCETTVPQMVFFNPDHLIPVAAGSAAPDSLTPTVIHRQMRTQFGSSFPSTSYAQYYPFGNSWFDKVTNRLYLFEKLVEAGAQFEAMPGIRVFQVGS